MIWAYIVTELNELQARDADSLKDLQNLSKKVEWLWIDFMDPTDKEFDIAAGLVDTKVVASIREQKVFSRPERLGNRLLFSIPQAVYEDGLVTFPIYVLIDDRMILTVRGRPSSKSFKNAVRTFQDCVGKVCARSANSLFVLSRLLHEISNENMDVVMMFRDNIDKIEEKVLVNPNDKKIIRPIFTMKREISAFERILWAQRELMLSVSEGVIPVIEVSEDIRTALKHPISNISRELTFLESHKYALDSILSLQDLGMIHRVEKKLISLTIMALIVSGLLILLEIDIIGLLTG